MNCPVCSNVQLVMSERQGIEIDYCPQCRGVWLDRGELDKIIERSLSETRPVQEKRHERDHQEKHHDDYEKRHKHDDDYYKHKKKKGFLHDLFD